MGGSTLNLHISTEMVAIDADEWDAIAGKKNPFVSHAFLTALEIGGAVGGNSGWSAMHLLLRDEDGQLLGAMPHYLKHHSYGEYIFDHSWANAFERAGGTYYPKLLGAIPFTLRKSRCIALQPLLPPTAPPVSRAVKNAWLTKGFFLPAMASHSSASIAPISVLTCRFNVLPPIGF